MVDKFHYKCLYMILIFFLCLSGYNNRLNSSESPPRTLINIVICCGMMLSVWLYSFYSAAILSYFTTNIDIIVRFPQLAESGFTVYAISSVNSSLPTHSDDVNK